MASVGRASAILGAGTLVSRITGLVRTVVLVAALGSVAASAGDAFAIANQLPNNIYAVISTGLLTGVIVPQIVGAARHKDGGSAFISKLLTLGVVALLAVTALVMVAAPVLVYLYGAQLDDQTRALTLALAYWCLPQVLFYGLYALLGEVLNAKRIFGPYTWSPIINNVISIIGFLAFMWVFGPQFDSAGWTPAMVAMVGGTATLGIVAQAGILLLFWRKASIRVRVDFQWRGMGLRHIGRLAGWTFLMVVVGQIAGLLQTNLVGLASGTDASVQAMNTAWFVFILPYSVIAYSIGTPYFTQLSEHASEGRHDAVRADLDVSMRTLSLFMAGALAAVVAAAVPISRILTADADQAVVLAWLLGAYLVGLIPLSMLFILQRTFYAYHDTRTPFLFTLAQAFLVIVLAFLAYVFVAREMIPLAWLAAGIALGQSLATVVQLLLAFLLLRRKLGPLGLSRAFRSLLRFILVAIPAAAAGWGVFLLSGGVGGPATADRIPAAFWTILIGGVSLAVYFLLLLALRTPELGAVTRLLRRFRPGR